MSLRDRIKERKNIIVENDITEIIIDILCDDDIDCQKLNYEAFGINARRKRKERSDTYKITSKLIEHLKTRADLFEYISQRIKGQYSSLGRTENWKPAIKAAINECDIEIEKGGIEAGQRWCVQFYLKLKNECNQLDSPTSHKYKPKKFWLGRRMWRMRERYKAKLLGSETMPSATDQGKIV